MTGNYQLIWYLDDYQSFLKHPDPLLRHWAATHIETQYPHQAAESFAPLLSDNDSHLQITAARAIANSNDTRYEPALLAVYPESEGYVRNWFTATLGQLRSPTLLPQLITAMETAPAHCPPEEADMLALHSVLDALGYYPDPVARSALWQFVERYQDNDRLTYIAFQGLLRFADPPTLPRLIECYSHLSPGAKDAWQHAILALADVVGLHRLTQEAIGLLPHNPDNLIFLLDDWLEQEISYSETFESRFDEAALRAYADLLSHILAELEHIAAKRDDKLSAWLAEWQAGVRPTGYRWRMLYAHTLLTSLVAHPPASDKLYQESVALGMALLAQVITDQHDEAALETAPNELLRQAILLNILESPRQHVMPNIVNEVVALGPGIVPHLIETLRSKHFWPLPRALEAITQIARLYPGAADTAVPAILDLMDNDQSDYVMEPAEKALVAIGPAVIDPAAMRLGWVDFAYNIFIFGALSNIPTRASAEALLGYITSKESLEDYEADCLADLGHSLAIPYLRDYYNWSGNVQLCTVLYKLAILNNYTGPELAEWQTVAQEAYANSLVY